MRSPLKILLADPDCSQYISLKNILQQKCSHYCNIFWYGDPNQYANAILSGTFDLAIMDSGMESLSFLLNEVKNSNNHTPVVLMVDGVTRDAAIMASESGVFGLLDKHHLNERSLGHYLVCAELFHRRELGEGFIAEVAMLGRNKHLQHSYTYIH